MLLNEKIKIDENDINILKEDWDYLIILDACRYDFFKKCYRDFFSGGVLKKATTPFTNTMEYLNGTFNEKYLDNVIYISSNPFINSIMKVSHGGLYFCGKNHFFEVVDVWDWGWNKKLGTVLPEKVNEATIKSKKENKNKKFIIHYDQPHSPYISTGGDHTKQNLSILKKKKSLFFRTLIKIRNIMKNIIKNDELMWKIDSILGLPPVRWRRLFEEFGKEGIRNAYEKDLNLVLKKVKELTENLPGKYIITADHGEMLGESGRWGHGYSYKECREIPWLIIKSKGAKKSNYKKMLKKNRKNKNFEEKIKERLESLGYLN